jgi:small subunit ribosomal protein S16
MPTKIRLQRFGKKGQPFYRIVVADSRAPRDGRFIENIGTYNPLTIPATIQINADRALHWLQVGAQPTETARAILSYKGLLYKHHLQKGVIKGAITQEQADVKFAAWTEEKEQKIAQKIKDKDLAQKENLKKRIQEETKVSEERAKAIAEKRAKELQSKVKAEEPETVVEETSAETQETQEIDTPAENTTPQAETESTTAAEETQSQQPAEEQKEATEEPVSQTEQTEQTEETQQETETEEDTKTE